MIKYLINNSNLICIIFYFYELKNKNNLKMTENSSKKEKKSKNKELQIEDIFSDKKDNSPQSNEEIEKRVDKIIELLLSEKT